MATLSSCSVPGHENPNSTTYFDPSVDSLLFPFDDLSLDNRSGTPLTHNSGGSPFSVSLAETQQLENGSGPHYRAELDYVPSMSIEASSQNIWEYNYPGYGGEFLHSTQHSGMGNLGNHVNYGNTYNNPNCEQVRIHPREIMYGNRHKLASASTNLASQFEVNHLINSRASVIGRTDSLLSQNYRANHVSEEIGRYGLNSPYGNYPCSRPPISNNFICPHHKKIFGLLSSKELANLAINEDGSQYLQNMLDRGDSEIRSKIAGAVLEYLPELMIDRYGHRLFHKLIKRQNINILGYTFWKIIYQDDILIRVSQNKQGSLSVQKIIKEHKNTPLIALVASALANEVYTLMTHQEGKYVILQCFNLLNNQAKEPLSVAVVKHCIPLATHDVGCISLNQCIPCISGQQRNCLLKKIAENSVCLSQDPSGNYVLQEVLKLQNPIFTNEICFQLRGTFAQLSGHKSGSHVVEKCLRSSGMSYIIQELLTSNKLLQLAQDQYGNYVIQTALQMTKCTNGENHQALLQALKPDMESLKFHSNGKNVYNLIISGVPLDDRRRRNYLH